MCGFNKRVHLHHIIKQVELGSNDEENLVYLCPNHHWIADFGTEEDRKKILRLIEEITGKIGCKISNEEEKILDLKIRVLLEKSCFKELVWDEKEWEGIKITSNYLSLRKWLIGRNCSREFSFELNDKAEKLILIRKIKDTMNYKYA